MTPNKTPWGLALSGAWLVDKSEGPSSAQVVGQIKNSLAKNLSLTKKKSPKVGHGGTLDPFATGLLVVLVGDGVKLSRYFLDSDKSYTGIIQFGYSTPSGDKTTSHSLSHSLSHSPFPTSLSEIQQAAKTFVQEKYLQVPPMFSAKKIDGKHLYELARKGIERERTPKECKIFDFEIVEFQNGQASFSVTCSSGTYVRVIAEDLAKKLGTQAHLLSLRRTGSGSLKLINACLSEEVFKEKNANSFLEFNSLLLDKNPVQISQKEYQGLLHGLQEVFREIADKKLIQSFEQSFIPLYLEKKLCAIARNVNSQWELERVFH